MYTSPKESNARRTFVETTYLFERRANGERGVMLMAKQMIDSALRQQVAQWTRTVLGQVIEDDRERSAAAPAVERTTCCIVGSGPAGAVLALLLARKDIPVVLLEAHSDFDRDFRSDVMQDSALEIMNELGLTDRLFQLHHTKLPPYASQMDACSCTQIDLIRLHSRHPYITLLAQADFLEVVTGEAKRYPTLRLIMGAHVESLIEESGAICGVRYRGHDGWHEVRGLLTIGADGCFSWVRRIVGWKPIPVAPPTERSRDDAAPHKQWAHADRIQLLGVLADHLSPSKGERSATTFPRSSNPAACACRTHAEIHRSRGAIAGVE
jgi:hypothetical protein